MFTFGREHERKSALYYVRDAKSQELVCALVDSVHDLVEEIGSEAAFSNAVKSAFIEGRSGAWEQAGTWLRKVGSEYPSVLAIWPELATHPQATVRFRVACHLAELPDEIRQSVLDVLAKDQSAKVREMIQAGIQERNGNAV